MADAMTGRDQEKEVLSGMVAEAAHGRGSALLIHGEAGIGKSELLRTAVADATRLGFRILQVAGLEPERWFPFAALRALIAPLLDGAGDLSPAHRETLSAVGAGTGPDPDVYRTGLAVLELLTEAAERQPVLLIADDLQWIDAGSRDALVFVARRAGGHSLLVLGAARTDHTPSFHWGMPASMHLGPLTATESGLLLTSVSPALSPSARALVLELAGGNPLALAELPAVVRAGHDALGHLPLSQRLEDTFAARGDATSRSCRILLLAIAAEPVAPIGRLFEVTNLLLDAQPAVDSLQEAIDAGLVRLIGGGVEFRHPLMRSAVYTRATSADRLAVHRAFAGLLSSSPARRLAHEAAATDGPDDTMAQRLERFADTSLQLGRVAAAVPALRRAAALVTAERRRTGILIRAAELSSQLSDRHLTQALLAGADLSLAGPVERAQLMLVSDNAAHDSDQPNQRIQDMAVTAGAAFAAGSPRVAENLLWRAAARCFFQDGDARVRDATAAQLDRWRPDPDAAHVLAVRAYTLPYRYGAEVIARLDRIEPDWQNGRTTHFLGTAAMVLGDATRAVRFLGPTATALRAEGRLGQLARALAGSWPRVYLGQLDQARADTEEGLALAEETDEKITWLGLKATSALAAALQGDTGAAIRAVRELRANRLFRDMSFATVMAQQVDGLLALLDGRADTAFDLLADAFDPASGHHHSVSRWLLAPDLADAALAAGRDDRAREVLAELPELVDRLPSEMMTVAHLYTDAVLAGDDEIEDRYRAAVERLPAGWPLARARLHLHYGRWLRRQRRDVESRAPLRLAREKFDRAGARPWADVAREQLRAAGESSGPSRPRISQQLSAQELRIATLAAQGLTNREIGARLFISHRTVGSQLYRIYPRLGITSRRDLAAALD